ncbi:MAG: TetR/AcrR family transcriptional regulator [Roseiflexaceae bacterium]
MRNTKADRRSQRTRQLLHTALIELMLERRYDEITVQDIIDRANVGRSTFYAHYLDKEDLLVSGFTQVLDALRQHMEQHKQGDWRTPPGLAFFFQHVQTHHQLYKALVRGGGIELLYKKGHERLRQNIEQHLVALVPAGQTPAAPLALVADYMAGAILTMLRWWLDNGMPYPPEQMDAMFQQLVLPGVQATLGIPA